MASEGGVGGGEEAVQGGAAGVLELEKEGAAEGGFVTMPSWFISLSPLMEWRLLRFIARSLARP